MIRAALNACFCSALLSLSLFPLSFLADRPLLPLPLLHLAAQHCRIVFWPGFLLPPEVVSCSYLPEPGLRAHCVRLLREQWESEARHLASIPEDGECGQLFWRMSGCAMCVSKTKRYIILCSLMELRCLRILDCSALEEGARSAWWGFDIGLEE